MWFNLTDEDVEMLGAGHALLESNAGYPGLEPLLKRIAEQKEEQVGPICTAYRDAAKRQQIAGESEIDDDAVASLGADNGAYVMAWAWVYASEAGQPDPDDDVETREHEPNCPAIDGMGCRCSEIAT